jgi:16S rRNA (adenine1518-N6/adenine1519-N6)-dimethyltransferase
MDKSTRSIRPLKQFGQHFLTDNTIADNIVQAAEINRSEPVWEIGPGQGVLTDRILALTDDVTAFEIDNRLSALLSSKYGNKLNLINRDILAVNWEQLLSEKSSARGQKLKLVSNLPYQITSPVLYAIEENAQWFSRIIIMIQKEVADRLTAKAGCKAYGVMTLKLNYAFRIDFLFNVPPEAFQPPPKVHSAVVMLQPRLDKPVLKSLDTYRLIINKAFTQRRKTLRNNMRAIFNPEDLKKLECKSGIDFNRRGETIEESEFVHLADCAFDMSCHQSRPE